MVVVQQMQLATWCHSGLLQCLMGMSHLTHWAQEFSAHLHYQPCDLLITDVSQLTYGLVVMFLMRT